MWGSDVADAPPTIPTRAQNRPAVPIFNPVVAQPYSKVYLTPERVASKELYFDVDTSLERQGFLSC